MKRNTTFAAFAAALLLIAAGCALPFGGTGSVALSLGAASRTIAPADMAGSISTYDLRLVPFNSGDAIELSVQQAQTVVADLEPGNWTVEVTARSSGGTRIAFGSAAFLVVAGRTARASVDLAYAAPDAGDSSTGSISLTIQIPATLIPVIPEQPGYVLVSVDGGLANEWELYAAPGPGYPTYDWAILDIPTLVVGSHGFKLTAYDGSDNEIATLQESLIVLPEVNTTAIIRYDDVTHDFKIGRPPAAPEGFSIVEVDLHANPNRYNPVLTWQPVAGVYSTSRESQPVAEFGYKLVNGVKNEVGEIVWNEAGAVYLEPYDTSYVDIDWSAGGSDLYYGLSALNAFGESPRAEVVQPALPLPPVDPRVTLGGTVTWDLVEGATGYTIRALWNDMQMHTLAVDPVFETYAEGTRAKFTLTDPDYPPGLLTDPLYAFFVTSLNGSREGPLGSFTFAAAVPQPFGLSIASTGTYDVTVTASWDRIEPAEQYRLYAKDEYGVVTAVATIDALASAGGTYFIPDLAVVVPRSYSYWFAVSALIGGEESQRSDWKSDSGSESGPGVYLGS